MSNENEAIVELAKGIAHISYREGYITGYSKGYNKGVIKGSLFTIGVISIVWAIIDYEKYKKELIDKEEKTES